MSTFSLARGPRGILGAFESQGQVRFAALAETKLVAIDAPGEPSARKHPSIACARDGSVLLAWTEGMGWEKGGALAWQVFGTDGKPMSGAAGRSEGVPAWSLVQAVAFPDGSFAILR
jgi:hypothetical protein